MYRRELLKNAAGLTGLAVFGTLISGPASAAVLGSPETLKSIISDNHGHVLMLSLVDFVKNGNHIYNIKGNAGHSHEIEVSLQAIQTLLQNKVIEIESSRGSFHSHTVRLQIV